MNQAWKLFNACAASEAYAAAIAIGERVPRSGDIQAYVFKDGSRLAFDVRNGIVFAMTYTGVTEC